MSASLCWAMSLARYNGMVEARPGRLFRATAFSNSFDGVNQREPLWILIVPPLSKIAFLGKDVV